MLKLEPVNPNDYSHLGFLYGVLIRRMEEPDKNISHKKVPSWDKHVEFIRSKPYRAHLLASDGSVFIGVCYVSNDRDVGIYLSPEHRRHGYGSFMLRETMERYRRFYDDQKLYANISPCNTDSLEFFRAHGFTVKSMSREQITLENEGVEGNEHHPD